MSPLEVKGLLTKVGFSGLSLVSSDMEKKTHTFKFTSFNDKAMLVKPTIAAAGKVAIYNLPDVGKIGMSPSTFMVRFIDAGKRDGAPKVSDKHLGFVQVDPELSIMFNKAAVSSGKRLAYMKALWQYLNDTKFDDQMKIPVLETGPKPSKGFGRVKTARGIYFSGPHWRPGNLWMAEFMFKAREPFFLEVFLHEMCHQAKWCISKSDDSSEQGHGPVWQSWMRKVGLDPRRFDPTDDAEYKDPSERIEEEEEHSTKYGVRRDGKYLDSLQKMEQFTAGPAIYVIKSRALEGHLYRYEDQKGVVFSFKRPNGDPATLYWKSLAAFNKNGLAYMSYPLIKGRT